MMNSFIPQLWIEHLLSAIAFFLLTLWVDLWCAWRNRVLVLKRVV